MRYVVLLYENIHLSWGIRFDIGFVFNPLSKYSR